MATRGQSPRMITWVICLVLYVIALLTHFGVLQGQAQLGTWSWIIGFAVLLIAVRVRGV